MSAVPEVERTVVATVNVPVGVGVGSLLKSKQEFL
jgi:hypothetical protein